MKKDKSPNKGIGYDTDENDRHGKLNFKNYLRDIREQACVEDEFSDVMLMQPTAIKKMVVESQTKRTITIGSECLNISDADLNELLSLHKDENITIVFTDYIDEDVCWDVTRSLNDEIIFECRDYEANGRIDYQEFIKRLK